MGHNGRKRRNTVKIINRITAKTLRAALLASIAGVLTSFAMANVAVAHETAKPADTMAEGDKMSDCAWLTT